MISLESRDPKKAAHSEELAKQMAEWEAKNGPVQTIPCGVGAPTLPYSVTMGGKAKRNPVKPTNLDVEDD